MIDSPGKDKEPSWLPARLGAINIPIRNDWPIEEALNGADRTPPGKKVQ
jgi:hypothetical protein